MSARRFAWGLSAAGAHVLIACSLLTDTSGFANEGGRPLDDGGGGALGADGATGTPNPDATPGSDAGPGPSLATSCGDKGLSICGARGTDDCCASPLVGGGVFMRGHDGVIMFDLDHRAQISSFRLDRFVVSVARFRRFVAARVAGWAPRAGDGKHRHLNDGRGLAVAPPGLPFPFEPGWVEADTRRLATSPLAWTDALSCNASFQTWSSSPADKEAFPINCVNWFEASAFCIWDGGFLPSEAELAYAAAGGDEQRVYPWSNPPKNTLIDCDHYDGADCGLPAGSGGAHTDPVGSRPSGEGRWGQADLAGNVFQWVADSYVDPLVTPCVDCVAAGSSAFHSARGSGFFNPLSGSANGFRYQLDDQRNIAFGFRCARSP